MLRRFCVTFAVALVCDAAIGLVSGQTATLIFFPLWIALVIGWPYLSHKLGFDLPKVPTPRPPAPKRPLGVRFLRGIGKLALALFILLIVPGLPLSFSFYRAESTRRTLHVGMTEAEVLHLVKGWDSMWVVSRASGSRVLCRRFKEFRPQPSRARCECLYACISPQEGMGSFGCMTASRCETVTSLRMTKR